VAAKISYQPRQLSSPQQKLGEENRVGSAADAQNFNTAPSIWRHGTDALSVRFDGGTFWHQASIEAGWIWQIIAICNGEPVHRQLLCSA